MSRKNVGFTTSLFQMKPTFLLYILHIYHILKDGVAFKALGADYYNQFNKERKINAYLKKLKALGWETPVVAA